MAEEDLGRYETDVELAIYKEYRDVLPMFRYVVETERRFYLANRGFKTANVPVVPGCPLPPELENLKRPLVVGLTCGADQLVDIRRSRLRMIGQDEKTEYVDPAAVQEEVKHARRVFSKTDWPVIDVTRRSIEETAAAVLQLHAKHIDGDI